MLKMSIIKRLQRIEKFWFGLIFDIPTRSINFALWERSPGMLSNLLNPTDSEPSIQILKAIKSGTFVWSPEAKDVTDKIKLAFPELKIPDSLDSQYGVYHILKNFTWKVIPNFTATMSSLENPPLRTPLCAITGIFTESPNKVFIPCAGKSAIYHEDFKLWARYETTVLLSEALTYTVEGYIVEDTEKMNEFFLGKKLTIVNSGGTSNGFYVRNLDDLKKYLTSIVELSLIKTPIEAQTIEIKLLDTGKTLFI